MYGLLLEAIAEHMKRKFGAEKWNTILQRAGVKHAVFSTHKVYSETLIFRLAKVAEEITNCDREQLMEEFGESFVPFLSQYGYDKILGVLGRRMRDFLSGLDNLHDYLRFTYPRLKAPSFSTSEETLEGLTLTYKSKRKGYASYVKGQIRKVGRVFYKVDMEIQVLKELISRDSYGVVYRLTFDNSTAAASDKGGPALGIHDLMFGTGHITQLMTGLATTNHRISMAHLASSADCLEGPEGSNERGGIQGFDGEMVPKVNLMVDSAMLFEVFPFHIIFDKNMIIRNAGSALTAIMSNLVGQNADEMFAIARPPIDFRWSKIIDNMALLFEITTIVPLQRGNDMKELDEKDLAEDYEVQSDSLHMKGAMEAMESLNFIIFLGVPVMREMDDMFKFNLYINDLCMHDSSRDLILAGTQHSAELKIAVEQELLKSKKIALNMKAIDDETKRTDQLLYQMIPRAVAERLRSGEPAINTCEIFDAVSILFTDIANFSAICAKISPMEVVTMLNNMYLTFDNVVAKHHVYKVETIADAYMIVSGAPNPALFHAQFMAEAAFDLVNNECPKLYDPLQSKKLHYRSDSRRGRGDYTVILLRYDHDYLLNVFPYLPQLGIHSGAVVAGVVGIKMPRYCLFGDTVNTASRIQSSSEPLRIQISETTNKELQGFPYKTELRGEMTLKGKGTMKTFWLVEKTDKEYSPMREARRRDYEANRKKSAFEKSSMLSLTSQHSHKPGNTLNRMASTRSHNSNQNILSYSGEALNQSLTGLVENPTKPNLASDLPDEGAKDLQQKGFSTIETGCEDDQAINEQTLILSNPALLLNSSPGYSYNPVTVDDVNQSLTSFGSLAGRRLTAIDLQVSVDSENRTHANKLNLSITNLNPNIKTVSSNNSQPKMLGVVAPFAHRPALNSSTPTVSNGTTRDRPSVSSLFTETIVINRHTPTSKSINKLETIPTSNNLLSVNHVKHRNNRKIGPIVTDLNGQVMSDHQIIGYHGPREANTNENVGKPHINKSLFHHPSSPVKSAPGSVHTSMIRRISPNGVTGSPSLIPLCSELIDDNKPTTLSISDETSSNEVRSVNFQLKPPDVVNLGSPIKRPIRLNVFDYSSTISTGGGIKTDTAEKANLYDRQSPIARPVKDYFSKRNKITGPQGQEDENYHDAKTNHPINDSREIMKLNSIPDVTLSPESTKIKSAVTSPDNLSPRQNVFALTHRNIRSKLCAII